LSKARGSGYNAGMQRRSETVLEHRIVPARSIAIRAAIALPLAFSVACALTACSRGPAELERRVDRILSLMSVEDEVSQLFMLPVEGSGDLSESEAAFLSEARPGAIILFGYNLGEGAASARELTASIQDALAASPLPALIAVDHEGGAVFRFKDSLTRLPSAARQGKSLNAKGIGRLAEISGSQLRALGISVNLAPIVEPLQPWNADFLKDRAYSSDPSVAAADAAAFARGMRRAGVAATLKHFPGNAAQDPHKGLPVLALEGRDLNRYALTPFRKAIASSKADLVMLSHAKLPAIDRDLPVSLSPAAISRLRRDLGFKGLILTDDLEMAALAAARPVRESALMAFEAGADMLMLSSRAHFAPARREILSALGSGAVGRARLDASARRIVRLKLSLGLMAERDPQARKTGFARLPGLLEKGSAFLAERF